MPFLTKTNAVSGGEKSNIINEVNGFLCKESIKFLEEILLNLCLNIDYARTLGKNAYDYYSKHCTLNNMVEKFKQAIENRSIVK